MIGDRLDNDIRPAGLQGWKTRRCAISAAAGSVRRGRRNSGKINGARAPLATRDQLIVYGRACVKTPALRLNVENLSRFRQSEK